MSAGSLTHGRRSLLQRRIRWIVAATISYNVIEAAASIAAGIGASSGALIAFGLDSAVEVLSAAAVAWQFTRRDPERWEAGTFRVLRTRRLRDHDIAVRAHQRGRSATQLLGYRNHCTERRRDAVPLPCRTASGPRARVSHGRCRLRSDAHLRLPVCSGTGWDGGGLTRSPDWSSPDLRSAKESRHGVATRARPRSA